MRAGTGDRVPYVIGEPAAEKNNRNVQRTIEKREKKSENIDSDLKVREKAFILQCYIKVNRIKGCIHNYCMEYGRDE